MKLFGMFLAVTTLLLSAFLALVHGQGSASQTGLVKNPTTITFAVSPDHELLTHYEVDFVRKLGSVVMSTINIGKPSPPEGSTTATAPINTGQLGFGTYYLQVRAVATAAGSTNALSNDFDRVPAPPSQVVVK